MRIRWAAWVVGWAVCVCGSAAMANRPNVLLVFADDQGTLDTNAYGSTDLYTPRSGVVHWTQGDLKAAKGINMALEEVTLAEALKKAGYATALFGKWHLGAPKDHGPTRQV